MIGFTWIEPYTRVRDGKRQDVLGHWRRLPRRHYRMVAWVVSLINIGVGLGLLPGGITSGFWPILWHWLKRIVHANGKARPFDDG